MLGAARFLLRISLTNNWQHQPLSAYTSIPVHRRRQSHERHRRSSERKSVVKEPIAGGSAATSFSLTSNLDTDDDGFYAPHRTIIDTPVKFVRLQRRKAARREQRNREFTEKFGVNRTRSPVIISGKQRGVDLSHYANQRYDLSIVPKSEGQHPQKGEMRLIAHNWYKGRSRGQSFAINQSNVQPKKHWMDQPELDDDKELLKRHGTFHSLLPGDRIWSDLADQLQQQCNITKPTLVQLKSISPALTGRHVYVAAETGCGKTVCYVLPMLRRLLSEAATSQSRAIILVPTLELAAQVIDVVNSISSSLGHDATIRADVCNNKDSSNDETSRVRIVVDTPTQLAHALHSGALPAEHVCTAVVDEADTLLDDSFAETTAKCISQLSTDGTQPGAQVVFASATLTSHFDEAIASLGIEPTQVRLVCSNKVGYLQHSLSRHRFERVTKPMKPEQLLIYLRRLIIDLPRMQRKTQQNKTTLPPPASIMVFVNRTRTATWLSEFLTLSGFSNVLISSHLSASEREQNFSLFRSAAVPILVCTDVSSRGIDIRQVSHVINYDFPPHLVDYVHRSGRVGRVGQQGVCGNIISFVQTGWQINHVAAIEKSIRLGRPLAQLETNTALLADRAAAAKRTLDGHGETETDPTVDT